jgi:hypothetical protein
VQVVRADVELVGTTWRFSLRLTAWQYPAILTGSDANWIVGEVELVRESRGAFRARHPVHARTEELAEFHRQLAKLLEHSAPDATLAHLESVFGAVITVASGMGRADVFIRDRQGARLALTDAMIEIPELVATSEQMDHVVRTFGVRGEAI